MVLAPGTYDIGPATGALVLRTSRKGVAARVGHDLTLTFEAWRGAILIAAPAPAADPGVDVAVDVSIDVGSLAVLSGSGGALPLSNSDRREIVTTARRLLDVRTHPAARFRSTTAALTGAGGRLPGELTMRGRTVPVTVVVTSTDDRAWHGAASVLQSAVGIPPYRAFLGALRLADRVAIAVDVDLSNAGA